MSALFPSDAISIREFSFRYNELELAVKCWESHESNSLPLIALHGWGENAGSFDRLAPALGYFPFYAPDLSGCGRSAHRSAGDDYYIWAYMEEVLALLDHLQFAQCQIIGHSSGGFVAILLAATYPERVSRLVLMNHTGPIEMEKIDPVDQLRKSLDIKRSSIGEAPWHYMSRNLAEQSRANRGVSLATAEALGQRGIAQDEQGFYWRTDLKLRRRGPISLSELQIRTFLSRIKAPSLLVADHPNEENWSVEIEERLTYIQDLKIERFEGNHFMHQEGDVEMIAGRIRTFLCGATQ